MLSPLREQQEKLEKTIMVLEEQIAKTQQQLVEAGLTNKSHQIGFLSKQIKEQEKEVEQLFFNLEEVALDLGDKEKMWADKIEELDKGQN